MFSRKTVRRIFYIFAGVFLLLLSVFTFTDLQIAERLYRPDSLFGRFFEIVGVWPTRIIGIFCCAALISTSPRRLCGKSVLSGLLGLPPLVHFALRDGVTLSAVCTLLWIAASFYLSGKIADSGKKDALRRAAIVGLAGLAAASLGVNALKILVSRERFLYMNDPAAEFTRWYAIQPVRRRDASFPSGHAAQSALTFWLTLLPTFIERIDRPHVRTVLFVFAIGFTGCTMLSRMLLGMHFASDVLVGAALTVTVLLLALKLTQSRSL